MDSRDRYPAAFPEKQAPASDRRQRSWTPVTTRGDTAPAAGGGGSGGGGGGASGGSGAGTFPGGGGGCGGASGGAGGASAGACRPAFADMIRSLGGCGFIPAGPVDYACFPARP